MIKLPDTLLDSARANDLARCQRLLAEGVDVHATDNLKWTALHLAARKGNIELCKLLLSAGANLHSADNTGLTPLHNAASLGHPMVCRLLLALGANIEARSDRLKTALHYAAFNGHVNACRELIQSGADLQSLDQGKCKPLHLAVLQGEVNVARFFFDECGESVDQRFHGKKTLDDLAKDASEPDMAAFLSQYRRSLITQKTIEDALLEAAPAPTPSRVRDFPAL